MEDDNPGKSAWEAATAKARIRAPSHPAAMRSAKSNKMQD